MIKNDQDVKMIVSERLKSPDITSKEKEILEIVNRLLDNYSFVDNQTYPRPTHPDSKKRKDAYFTLIAILISLRTTLENEQKAVENFCNRFSDINEVAKADKEELMSLISCAGMPNKKAQNIIDVSNYIIEHYDGDINSINNSDIESIKEKLFKIPGLGEKSVDCMLELAFDLPSIVVDTNVFRVISRVYFPEENLSFENKNDVLKIKNFIESNLIKDYRLFQIVHTIILLHGKHICNSAPKCGRCVISDKCKYYSTQAKNIQLELNIF